MKRKLPKPPVPPEADLRAVEPPWHVFRDMLIEMGATPEKADQLIAEAKSKHPRLH